MSEGCCLCGTVRWRATGEHDTVTHCHCEMCRKAHAAPFGSYTSVSADCFEWLAGEGEIGCYESSPGAVRAFCRICGSVTPYAFGAGHVGIPAGVVDTGAEALAVSAHIFVAWKAPWHVIGDDLPQYEAWPPGDESPVIERAAAPAGTPATVPGSCLCGAVAFEVKPDWQVVHNCHCSRCRKARAAAFTTNGFTAIENLVFLRGEDRIVSYKVPEARFFRHNFCRTCGSGMPRRDPERGFAVIPFGALDGDPGRGADDHIFVADGAPWYTIADSLPRHEQAPG